MWSKRMMVFRQGSELMLISCGCWIWSRRWYLPCVNDGCGESERRTYNRWRNWWWFMLIWVDVFDSWKVDDKRSFAEPNPLIFSDEDLSRVVGPLNEAWASWKWVRLVCLQVQVPKHGVNLSHTLGRRPIGVELRKWNWVSCGCLEVPFTPHCESGIQTGSCMVTFYNNSKGGAVYEPIRPCHLVTGVFLQH